MKYRPWHKQRTPLVRWARCVSSEGGRPALRRGSATASGTLPCLRDTRPGEMAAGSPHTAVGQRRLGSAYWEIWALERGCSNPLCLKETNSSCITIISKLHCSRGAGVWSQRVKQGPATMGLLWRLKTKPSVGCGWSPQALCREGFV